MHITLTSSMARRASHGVLRAIDWFGVVAALPLLVSAAGSVSDSPLLPEQVIRSAAVLLFPLLSLIGLLRKRLDWLGAAGLVLMVAVQSMTAMPGPTAADNDAYAAVKSGDARSLRTALARGADPDFYTEDRGYLLSAAVLRDDPANVKLLIEAGADVNVRKANWSTPLLTAVYLQNCEAARLLLEAGASLEDRFYDYWHYTDPPTYLGRTVREIYAGRKAELQTKRTWNGACWRRFEARLADPPPSKWTARRVFQEAVLPFLRVPN